MKRHDRVYYLGNHSDRGTVLNVGRSPWGESVVEVLFDDGDFPLIFREGALVKIQPLTGPISPTR